MAVTKWNFQIKKAEDIPETLAKAFHFARTGRPGPVLIDITKDAQFQELDYQYKKIVNVRSYIPYPKLNIDEIKGAADIINEAKNPLLLVGQGVLLSDAQEELKTFVEKSGIPVASTLLGLSALPSSHPLFMGMLGMHGNYGPNKVTNECDVLVAVGMRFDDRVTGNLNTYAKQAKIIHLELDRAEINKNVKVDVSINADAKQALTELTKYINKKSYPKSIEKFEEYKQVEFEKIINGDLHPESKLPKMGEVVNKVSEQTKGEAVVVTDVGQHQMSTARYYQFNKPHSLITSGGLGTMGFGLPAALGAKLGTDRDVVVFIGDGGFQMTIQELGTISQTKAPVKIILLNNGFLGMVRQWQDMFFDKRYSSVELTNPDFLTIAKGYGISARRVSSHEELDEAIQQMLEHDEAFLLEVVVEKEENVFPMVPAGGTVSDMRLE